MSQKSITIRLPKSEYIAFDAVCYERGYSKTGKIRELIRALVKSEIEEVELSAEEWAKVENGIAEIERGESVSLEELKSRLEAKRMGHK